jgi:hypothetical protein
MAAAGLGLLLVVLSAILSHESPLYIAVPLFALTTIFVILLLPLLLVATGNKVLTKISSNYYGLCSGYIRDRKPTGAIPLTEWLADMLDEIAEKPNRSSPLTFGDL